MSSRPAAYRACGKADRACRPALASTPACRHSTSRASCGSPRASCRSQPSASDRFDDSVPQGGRSAGRGRRGATAARERSAAGRWRRRLPHKRSLGIRRPVLSFAWTVRGAGGVRAWLRRGTCVAPSRDRRPRRPNRPSTQPSLHRDRRHASKNSRGHAHADARTVIPIHRAGTACCQRSGCNAWIAARR